MSKYAPFFAVAADDKFTCLLCDENILKTGYSTTASKRHMEAKHPDKFKKVSTFNFENFLVFLDERG